VRGGVETPFQQAKRLASREGPIRNEAELQEHVKAFRENAPAKKITAYGKDTYVTPEEEPDVDKGKDEGETAKTTRRKIGSKIEAFVRHPAHRDGRHAGSRRELPHRQHPAGRPCVGTGAEKRDGHSRAHRTVGKEYNAWCSRSR
jgi:hypothetical protein